MKKVLLITLIIYCSKFQLLAHCQVPCGIYNDSARIMSVMEDYKTIEKAMIKIIELAKDSDPKSTNQIVRWVNTKEEHATNIQNTISSYFMTQRLKKTDDKYIVQLELLHKILVNSMVCKQTINQENPMHGLELVNSFSKIYLDKHGAKHLRELINNNK